MYDVVIVGAGPAGMTAAIYACRANKKVLVLEAVSYGGQIVNAFDIENYPGLPHISGFDFANHLYEQAVELGAEFIFEKVIKIENEKKYKKVITLKNMYDAKSIILAVGVQKRKLGLPLEEELLGKGISYCATCDGAFYRNQDVAVVGGGNTALEDALYLSQMAHKVYLIHRREEFRGDEKILKQLREKDNVTFLLSSTIEKLNAGEVLESITVLNSKCNASTIPVSALFIAIGQVPENDSFKDLLSFNQDGYFVAREDCSTNVCGIFVAGDCREKSVRQLVTATSDGAVAVQSALKYLNS